MTELVHISKDDFMPVMERQDAIDRYNAIVDFVKDTMKEDLDFGTIPGTNKPTLYKPGAEKLGTLFGLTSRFEIIEEVEDWTGSEHNDEPFFYYKFVCRLYRGDRLAGEGYGSCNSWEKKYRYRQADLKCPSCETEGTVIKGKAEYGGGWLCWNKKGGCGAKWPDGAEVIEGQERGLIPNPDIYTQTNTILKMAKKRAFIDAILITVNASEFFTQDVEDMMIDADYRPVEQKPASKQSRWPHRMPYDQFLEAAYELGYDSEDAVKNALKRSGYTGWKADEVRQMLEDLESAPRANGAKPATEVEA